VVKVTKGAIWTLKAILSDSADILRLTPHDNVELDLQPQCKFNGKLDSVIVDVTGELIESQEVQAGVYKA
jgi:hypothetical protein